MSALTLTINGAPTALDAPTSTTLLDVLRETLQLTGTKRGCNYGVCGACTVLLDGRPARSCLALAHCCDRMRVTTIEGLEIDGALDPIQQALIDAGAAQCGFCTSGIALVARALLDARPDPTPAEIRAALTGNLCRCTGYAAIVDAIVAAATQNQAGRHG